MNTDLEHKQNHYNSLSDVLDREFAHLRDGWDEEPSYYDDISRVFDLGERLFAMRLEEASLFLTEDMKAWPEHRGDLITILQKIESPLRFERGQAVTLKILRGVASDSEIRYWGRSILRLARIESFLNEDAGSNVHEMLQIAIGAILAKPRMFLPLTAMAADRIEFEPSWLQPAAVQAVLDWMVCIPLMLQETTDVL